MKASSLCIVALLAMGATACKIGTESSGIAAARAKLVSAMKDPDSVKWRNEQKTSDGTTLCGEVNAKNALGGYVGFKPFIANSSGFVVHGGKFNTWNMASNREPASDDLVKGAALVDSGKADHLYRDIWELLWATNCK